MQLGLPTVGHLHNVLGIVTVEERTVGSLH